MPYLGNQLEGNYTSFETQTITGDGSTSYTLSNAVTNGKELLVYINNVKQEEGSGKSYTASGTTITFSDAVASTDSCYVVYLGRTSQTVSPPDGSLASYSGNTSLDGAVTINESSADVDFRVESGGNANMLLVDGGNDTVVVGQSAPDTTVSGGTPAFQVIGSGFDSSAAFIRRQANQYAPSVMLAKSRSVSVGSHTIVQDDDEIGGIVFIGDDGTDLDTYGATIQAKIDGSPAANNMPTELLFSTNAGASTVTERMKLGKNGDVTVSDGDLVIGTSGHGISFAATSDTAGVTMGSELLADYEEGTYDVTMTCGSSGTITVRSDYNTGGYIKVGNLVTVYGYVVVSAISSPNGYIQVNLPFAVTNTSEGHASSAIYVHIGSLSGKNTNEIGNGLAFNGQSYFRIYSTDSTAYGTSSANSLTSSSFMYFGGSYRTG